MTTPTHRNRRRTGKAPRRSAGTPGWVLVLGGLVIGIAAVATYDVVRERLAPPATTEPPPVTKPKPRPAPVGKPPEKDYEFYDMLPNFEVVVPEEDHDVRPDRTAAPVEVPGVYVLQAGSYSSFAEADKVKAQLALLGISSQIQKISVEERQYHRVRIGPIEKLDELNRVRQRLRNARIEVLVIRVGE